MRKLFLFMLISLDGYFEGPDHNLSWHNVDAEFNEFAIEQTKNVGTLLFGRRTYELMRDFWPTEEARMADPVVANLMNTTPKVVFSKTLKSVSETKHWKEVTLVGNNIEGVVNDLKKQSGKDLAVFGSSNLCVSLLRMGLLDELRIMVCPVAIGRGTPLFQGIREKVKLILQKTRTFKNGNILLTYLVNKKEQ